MSDALVARIEEALAVADQEEQLSFCVSERYENVTAASIECDDLRALLTAYATVQAERDAARADVRRLIEQNEETTREWGEDVTRLRAELATLRDTLVGEVEARLHEKRMSFEMSGPHGDVDYRATFSFDEGGSWVRWPEIAAILNAIKGTP